MIDGNYTIKEIVKETGVSRSTLYKLEKLKKITFKRLNENGKVHINLEELKGALK